MTMLVPRVAAILALAFGVVGVGGCAAGAYGVWRVASRLDRANDKLFDTVDRSLEGIQNRVPDVQKRVKGAKVTTAEISAAIRAWAAKKLTQKNSLNRPRIFTTR